LVQEFQANSVDTSGHSEAPLKGTCFALKGPALLENIYLSHEINHESNKIQRWLAIDSATMKLTPTTHMWNHNSGDDYYQSALEKR